jgi:sarcosine oxidase subunit beta
MAETFDAIIIGGGVHGASLAYHLAQRNVKVVVLERKFIASGATGRSSGLVRMHYDLEPESRLAWESFLYFRNWSEMVGGECGFTRTGFLQFITPDYLDQLKANVAMHQKIGIPSLLISVDDVRRLAPAFYLDDIEFAAFEPESGYADPSQTTQSLLEAARKKSARLVQDCEVTDVLIEGGRVTGVRSSKGEYSAPIVVNAAGAWANRIARMVGLDLPIDTWQHDTLFIRRPKTWGNRTRRDRLPQYDVFSARDGLVDPGGVRRCQSAWRIAGWGYRTS